MAIHFFEHFQCNVGYGSQQNNGRLLRLSIMSYHAMSFSMLLSCILLKSFHIHWKHHQKEIFVYLIIFLRVTDILGLRLTHKYSGIIFNPYRCPNFHQ